MVPIFLLDLKNDTSDVLGAAMPGRFVAADSGEHFNPRQAVSN